MNNGNGKQRWIFWLVGTITFIITSTLTMTITNVIANDKASRERDECIEKEARVERIEMRKEVTKELKELNTSQTQILIALAELKKDLNNAR